MLLLIILDSLGTSEVLLILAVALIFFGPRKLPQLSRQIGKGLAEFRKASEDFKRTWEREVDLESTQSEPEPRRSVLPAADSVPAASVERSQPGQYAGTEDGTAAPLQPWPESTASNEMPAAGNEMPKSSALNEPPLPEPTRKRDWL